VVPQEHGDVRLRSVGESEAGESDNVLLADKLIGLQYFECRLEHSGDHHLDISYRQTVLFIEIE
jgi:hypothetical protein